MPVSRAKANPKYQGKVSAGSFQTRSMNISNRLRGVKATNKSLSKKDIPMAPEKWTSTQRNIDPYRGILP
jgi:hypothetical protein